MENEIFVQAQKAVYELMERSGLKCGQILVVGCSSSEVNGCTIGTNSAEDTAQQIFDAIYSACQEKGIFLAAQCCEHLNRAIVISQKAVVGQEIVNVVPQKKAGGSFATAAYHGLENAVVVEEIKADAGMDIGGTLIGMHLKKVAVPLRLQADVIGKAKVLAARTRPKFIGGVRACYDETML